MMASPNTYPKATHSQSSFASKPPLYPSTLSVWILF